MENNSLALFLVVGAYIAILIAFKGSEDD